VSLIFIVTFLGMFRKLQKVTGSFVMSVSPHVEHLGFHWLDFHEICYVNIFQKSLWNIQV